MIVAVLAVSLVAGVFTYTQAKKSSVPGSGESSLSLINPTDGLPIHESFSRAADFSIRPRPTTLLALDPAYGTYNPGDTFDVDVKIDTAYINGQTTVGDVRVGLQYDYRFLDFTGWDTENPASEFSTFYFHHASHSIIFFDEGNLLMTAHTDPGPTYTTGYNDPPGQVFRLSFKVKDNVPFMSSLGAKAKIEFNEHTGVWSDSDPDGFNYLADTQDGSYIITP